MNSDSSEDEFLQAPVFRPTEDEFQDFELYITKIEKLCENFGYAKIIPPNGWYQRDYDISSLKFRIPTPIKQLVSGHPGIHDVHLQEQNEMSIQEYYDFAMKNSYDFKSDEEIERKFWRSLGNNGGMVDPIYGADIPGSLFGDFPSAWNVNKLNNKLQLLFDSMDGVNTAMLYFGSWRAMFAYHVEDMNLFSINYLHTGAPKYWCFIPVSYQHRFENFAQSHFKSDFYNCSEYLRHKTKLISPKRLRAEGITVHTVVQHEGEFMITFPRAYHCGFNYGFNIAESTNFATASWIPHGYMSRICRCEPSSVRIYMPYIDTLIHREHVKEIKGRVNQLSSSSSSSSSSVELTRRTGRSLGQDTAVEEEEEEEESERDRQRILEASQQSCIPITTYRETSTKRKREISRKIRPLLMRCRCTGSGGEGPRISDKKRIQQAVDQHEIIRCIGCERWCHTVCTSATCFQSSAPSSAVGESLCDICLYIEWEEEENQDHMSILEGRVEVLPSEEEDTSKPSREREGTGRSQSQTRRGKEIDMSSNNNGKKKRKRKSSSSSSHISDEYPVQKGSMLLLRRSPYCFQFPLLLSHSAGEEEVVGKVVDLEDGCVRVHVKGEPRDQDMWVNIEHVLKRMLIKTNLSTPKTCVLKRFLSHTDTTEKIMITEKEKTLNKQHSKETQIDKKTEKKQKKKKEREKNERNIQEDQEEGMKSSHVAVKQERNDSKKKKRVRRSGAMKLTPSVDTCSTHDTSSSILMSSSSHASATAPEMREVQEDSLPFTPPSPSPSPVCSGRSSGRDNGCDTSHVSGERKQKQSAALSLADTPLSSMTKKTFSRQSASEKKKGAKKFRSQSTSTCPGGVVLFPSTRFRSVTMPKLTPLVP